MDNTITIVVTVDSLPEYHDLVKKYLIELAAETRLEEGNLTYVLHETTTIPRLFIIYEQWEDQKALDFHMNKDYLKNFLAASEKLLKQPVSGIICNEVEIIS